MSSRVAPRLYILATLSFATLAAILATAAAAQGTQLRAERLTVRGSTSHGVKTPIEVKAVGPITGRGTGTFPTPSRLTVHLPEGSISFTSKATSRVGHLNLQACTATITQRGTFKIVRGTGRYAHATASGRYTERRKLIGARARSGRCEGQSAPPQAVYTTAVLTGTAALSSM